MLPRSSDVAALAETVAAAPRTGAVWIDATSGEPEASKAIYASLADDGVAFVDCGVAGGPRAAADGTLAAMVRLPARA